MRNPVMGAADWGLLFGLAGLWGGSFLFGKIAVQEIPPMTLVLYRVGLAAILLGGVVLLRREPLPRRKSVWLACLVMGLLNNAIPFALFFWAQTRISSGLAAVLNAATPLFSAVLAHLLTNQERLTPARLTGVLIGMAGVAVMVSRAFDGRAGAPLAEAACLAAALSYAFAGLFGRRFLAGVNPLASAAGQLAGATLLVAPVAALTDPHFPTRPHTAAALGAVLALASLCTALAYLLFFRLLARAGATNAMLVTLLVPVSAILLGAVVLGERLEPAQLAGMALIAVGLAVMDGRPGARLYRAFAARPRA